MGLSAVTTGLVAASTDPAASATGTYLVRTHFCVPVVAIDMARTIDLQDLEARLAELSYPMSPSEATEALADTEVELADGHTALDEVVAQSNDDRFDSVEDLASEIRALLPREAVGEPYQSEGEG